MFKAVFSRLIGGLASGQTPSSTAPIIPPVAPTALKTKLEPEVVQTVLYPPADGGIPIADLPTLLAAQDDTISRIKLHAAADTDRYEKRFLRPITALASHINALPGSIDAEFGGAGGLLRACIDMAFFSFQASDGRIFTGSEGVEARHAREPRWRYICFAAGLLYPVGQLVERVTVTTQRGHVWPKHGMPLTQWALDQCVDRVFVSMGSGGGSALGPSPYASSMVASILGPENLAWLENETPELTKALFEIVSGAPTKAEIARDLVQQMWKRVLDRETTRMPQNYGRLSAGSHLAPHLVGAIRTAMQKSALQINEKHMVGTTSGAYLQWPQAAQVIIDAATSNGAVGVPHSPSVIAQALMDASVFEKNPIVDNGRYEVQTSDGEIVWAYKLRNPKSIIDDWDPSAFAKKKSSDVPAPQAMSQEEAKFLEAQGQIDFGGAPQVQKPAAQTIEGKVELQSATTEQGAETSQAASKNHEAPKKKLGTASAQPAQQELIEHIEPESIPQPKSATKKDKPKPAPGQPMKEVPDESFASKLTESLRSDLKSLLASEQVGKLLHAYQTDPKAEQFVMTNDGLVVAYAYFGKQIASDPPKLLEAMSNAGLIYTNPATPGLKISQQKFAGKEASAITVSNYGLKALGIDKGAAA
jgi:hypothetical protein